MKNLIYKKTKVYIRYSNTYFSQVYNEIAYL